MSAISITRLYDLLLVKLGKETAQNLASFIEEKVNEETTNKIQTCATKNDLTATKDDLAKEIARLDNKIGETKSELIKWMFIFWIGQVAVTFGFILVYLKK